MEFRQIDVFADRAFGGNPLAVFPDAQGLNARQMQAIAREMNLSATTFVTGSNSDSYSVRIFTPSEELPFAGHPTVGTTWVLRSLGKVVSDRITQHSPVGATGVEVVGEIIRFERPGRTDNDLEETDQRIDEKLARALALEPSEIGLEARELGRSGRLRPARADAGAGHLMVPVRDLASLGRCRPSARLLEEITKIGAYCFTGWQAGRVRARGFFPTVGIDEDPATGSAAAELGIFLADRLGAIKFEVIQGVEMGRPSRIFVEASEGKVTVGGRCEPILVGELQSLPAP